MASDITISSLTAIPGVGQVTLSALPQAPAGMSCLSYMMAAKVRFWVATSNNRNVATQIAESEVGFLVHGGLPASATRYYWAQAIDPFGEAGPFFPASVTGGISATTSNQVPPAGSVGSSQIQNGAVTNEKVASLNADKIVAASLSAISGNFGNITSGNVTGVTFTGNVIRTSATGRRIEINSADNFLRVYDTGGNYVASIGEGGLEGALISAGSGRSSASATASFSNAGSGPAVSAVGQMSLTGLGNRAAFDISWSPSGGGNAHGLRGRGFQGGAGLVGASASSGGWAFYAETGGYGPFTGAHPGMLLKEDEIVPGDILIDVKVLARRGLSDTLTEVRRSSEDSERGVIGVLERRAAFDEDALINVDLGPVHRRHLAKKYDHVVINALGEGQVNVCGLGGDIRKGDYIVASSMPGKGRRLDPDTVITARVKSTIVARAREDVTFARPTDVKLVSCIYGCG